MKRKYLLISQWCLTITILFVFSNSINTLLTTLNLFNNSFTYIFAIFQSFGLLHYWYKDGYEVFADVQLWTFQFGENLPYALYVLFNYKMFFCQNIVHSYLYVKKLSKQKKNETFEEYPLKCYIKERLFKIRCPLTPLSKSHQTQKMQIMLKFSRQHYILLLPFCVFFALGGVGYR